MSRILAIHGPNLNLLGTREPNYYGVSTLANINDQMMQLAHEFGHQLFCKQSNAEHELIQFVQDAITDNVDFIVINPAAYTHSSIALRDALAASRIPFIEVHLSNIYQREEFRHHSYFSDIAQGVISGLGAIGYELALRAAHQHLASISATN